MAAIITATDYQALTGQTFTGDALTAVSGLCAAVSDALSKYLRPYSPTPVTLTSYPMDAPPSNVLVLPVLPVRTLTAILSHPGANGEVAAFDATNDLLTVNDDYWMPTDPFDGYSRDGKVYRRGTGLWGLERRYATQRSLEPTVDPNRGALLVTAACGEASVPDAIREAAKLMVSLLYARRTTGMPVTSESWNGYAGSYAGPFTATGAIDSPDVQSLLRAYRPQLVHTAAD